MERKRYIFRYNDVIIADWLATEEQMIFHAQGMVIGLRQFRKNVSITVHEVVDGTERLARVQRQEKPKIHTENSHRRKLKIHPQFLKIVGGFSCLKIHRGSAGEKSKNSRRRNLKIHTGMGLYLWASFGAGVPSLCGLVFHLETVCKVTKNKRTPQQEKRLEKLFFVHIAI